MQIYEGNYFPLDKDGSPVIMYLYNKHTWRERIYGHLLQTRASARPLFSERDGKPKSISHFYPKMEKRMEIIISNNANKPIYEQITSQIKAMIMSGELQAGDSIPSMRALAKSIHVSVITVQKAYEDLQRDGFIETTVGRGSFVSAQNKEFYQEEQQRIAEEHLQAAAEIGRTSNISLEKLTELLALFYTDEE